MKYICGITKRVGMPTTICRRTIKSPTNSPLYRAVPLYVNAAAKDRAAKVAAAAERICYNGGLATSVKRTAVGCAKRLGAEFIRLNCRRIAKIMGGMTWQWKSRRFLTPMCSSTPTSRKSGRKILDVSIAGTGGGGGEYPLQDGWLDQRRDAENARSDLSQEKPCDSMPSTRPASLSATPTKTPSAAFAMVTRVYSRLTRRWWSTLTAAVSRVAEGGKSPAPQSRPAATRKLCRLKPLILPPIPNIVANHP